jgi:hypothetical protein
MDTLANDPITPFIQDYLAKHAQDIIAGRTRRAFLRLLLLPPSHRK